MAAHTSPGFQELSAAVARCSEGPLHAWHSAAFVGLNTAEASRLAQLSGCPFPVGGPEEAALQTVCGFYAGSEATSSAVAQLNPLLPQLFGINACDVGSDASLPADVHDAQRVVRWCDVFRSHIVASMRRLKAAGHPAATPPVSGLLDEDQCAGGLASLEAAGVALLTVRRCLGDTCGSDSSGAAGSPSQSSEEVSVRSPWCVFFGHLAFVVSCTTRIQALLLQVHCHAMTGDAIHVLRAAAWMKAAHRLLHLFAENVTVWDRASKLNLFNAATMGHLPRFQLLCVVFQKDRMGIARRLVDLFGILWGRCSLLFSDCLDVPYATTYDDAATQPTAACSAFSNDGSGDGTHTSTTQQQGTHPNDDSDNCVSPLVPSMSSAPPTRSASPAMSLHHQPQTQRGGGGGVASRLLNFVKRGRTEPARVHVADVSPRELTMHQQMAVPTTSSVRQAAIVQAHSRHNLLCRTLSERGSDALSVQLASFYLLTQRPIIRRATFLLILDNSSRAGPCLWRHGTLVPSATYDTPSERSAAQCWTLCYSSDGMRGSTAHVKKTWHYLQSFVFLLAGADGDFFETTHHTEHLQAQRVAGFDKGNLFACVVMDVHVPPTSTAAPNATNTVPQTAAVSPATTAAAPLDPTSIKAERALSRHLLQSFAETWCGPMQWVA